MQGMKGCARVDKDKKQPANNEEMPKRQTSQIGDHIQRATLSTGTPAETPASRLSTPWRLLMQIGGQFQTTVGLEVRDKIIIGRSDPVSSFYPDLDLSPYGGQEHGVSRRHATIVQDDEQKALFLEDLNSTNGTRINGFSLEPRRRYRLRDGDELEFGQVQMVLSYI